MNSVEIGIILYVGQRIEYKQMFSGELMMKLTVKDRGCAIALGMIGGLIVAFPLAFTFLHLGWIGAILAFVSVFSGPFSVPVINSPLAHYDWLGFFLLPFLGLHAVWPRRWTLAISLVAFGLWYYAGCFHMFAAVMNAAG